MSDKLKIVCWLWREQLITRPRQYFTIDHVRIWRDMISRNLSMPHELVCITDQPKQVPKGVRYIPLWDDLLEWGGCFVRLKCFSKEIGELIGGKFASMDLDCAVLGKLDPLFDRPEPAMFWSMPGRLQGSMWMVTPGVLPELWDDFYTDNLEIEKKRRNDGAVYKQWIHGPAKRGEFRVGTDQRWISYRVQHLPEEKRQQIGYWTEYDGVVNVSSSPKHYKKRPPDNARIAFFSGPEDPMELRKSVPWIAECYG